MDKHRTNVAKAFGAALREARQKAGLSQEDLALESGVDGTFVSMLERGIRQPALATIVSLCAALPLSAATLVERTERGLYEPDLVPCVRGHR
jgi:transcriptional regulator with XRE-family HTH domain